MTARIVLIEDDRSMRELVALHLRNAGYEVEAAEDVIAGGHAILRAPPDLLLCDVELPYLNGYDFVATLKEDDATRHIPVVFMSVREDVDEHAKRLGAAGYLRKPLIVDRLLDVVSRYVGRG